ncbi:MAG TPA: hypothetical protein DDX98_07155 [Bacteroidales bacterium]|jgi:Ni,Fe-hydrogenase III component G|nr:hypothetical protein [Bacteroidales bacterium]
MELRNDQIILILRDRIKKIIHLHEAAKEKNRTLEVQKEELEEKMRVLRKEKDELSLKYNNLKLAKQLHASLDNTHDAKLKVNRIVREIDKCIALLNK